MKNIKKAILLSMCLILLLPVHVMAAGNITLFTSNGTPKVGDSFVVTVRSSENAQIKVSYISSVLELAGSDVTGSSTGNTFTFTGKEAKLTFKAKAAGTSGVIVESPTVTGASFNVVVSDGGEAAPVTPQTPTIPETTETTTEPTNEEPAATPEQSGTTGVPEGSDFAVDGIGYVLSERYKDNEIPAGFTETRMDINGKNVRELTNGFITLVYLKPTDNTEGSGEFYVYDAEAGTVSKMVLLGAPDNYVILDTPENFFSSSLEPAELNTGDRVVSAYHISGSDSEFYYIYGSNSQGAKGWYAYDSLMGTISRADIMSLAMIDYAKDMVPDVPEDTLDDSENTEKIGFFEKLSGKITDFFDGIGVDISGIDTKLILMIVAGVVGLIIIIAVIVSLIRRRDDYYDDEYYEDEDEDVDGEGGPITESLEKPDKEENSLIDDLLSKVSDKDKKDVDIINLDDL